MTEGDRPDSNDDEHKKNQPYRRLLATVFALTTAVLCTFTFRGIVQTLDRLPSVDRLHRPDRVDTRALVACADDLIRLERRTRALAAKALTLPDPAHLEPWATRTRELELERVKVSARCRLTEPSNDPVVQDLAQAAAAVEALMRTYGLLYDRFRAEGYPRSQEATDAALRARAALKTRD